LIKLYFIRYGNSLSDRREGKRRIKDFFAGMNGLFASI